MPLNLNTASNRKLRKIGLSEKEVELTRKFLYDNAVFHSISEWKKECRIPARKYKAIKRQLTTDKAGVRIPQKVTTHAYRKRNCITDPDVDVGHIIAHANRGADHPDNYVLMNKHYNRKLGNLHDGIIFAHLNEDRLRKAVRVSRLQKDYEDTLADVNYEAEEALQMRSELPLYIEGYLGGFEETDDDDEEETDEDEEKDYESLLCHREYCKALIQKWRKHYPVN